MTTLLTPQPGPALAYVSASQIQLYQRCPRAWAYKYRFGQRDPETAAMKLGKEIHASLEAYLQGEIRGEDLHPRARPALDKCYLDFPYIRRLLVEQPIHRGTTDNPQALTSDLYIAGVPVVGFVDLFVHSQGERAAIWDHKTTSDWKWAKTSDQLRYDTQQLLYAAWALKTFDLDEIEVGHIQYLTKGAPESRRVSTILTRDHVNAQIVEIAAVVEQMKLTATTVSPAEAFPAVGPACSAFGGCKVYSLCASTPYNPGGSAEPPTQETTMDTPPLIPSALQAILDRRSRSAAPAPSPAPEPPTPSPSVDDSAALVCPPDAPDELEPVTLDMKPVSTLSAATPGVVKGLADEGITTLGELHEWSQTRPLTSVKGIGPKKEESILAELEDLFGAAVTITPEIGDREISAYVKPRDPHNTTEVYIGCRPTVGKDKREILDLEREILAPLAARVASEAGVPYFDMPNDFGAGRKALAALFSANLGSIRGRRWYARRDSVTVAAVLHLLIGIADFVVEA